MARVVAATCWKGRVWRVNRLAPRIYAPQVCSRVAVSPVDRAWPRLSLRRMASTGIVGKKERILHVGKIGDDDEEDEDDEEEDDEFDDPVGELKADKDDDNEEDEDIEEEDGEDNIEEDGEDFVEGRKEVDDPGELEIIRRISATSGEEEAAKTKKPGPWKSQFPALSQKEKKELRAHAHRLGKSIALQHVGKWGVTPNTIKCFGDALEKNELLKVRVLDNCPMDFSQVMLELEEGLEAQVVGKVGHVFLLYRPSLRKAEMDEKKQKIDTSRKKKSHARQERGWRA